MNLIFDLGANTGGNLRYYLSKARRVVSVEANPALIPNIEKSFAAEIASGELVILNACICIDEAMDEVDFYVHHYETELSSFVVPKTNVRDYTRISTPSISVAELVRRYGNPDFVKCDLEGYDKVLLNHLLVNNELPEYLAIENPGRDMLERLVRAGKYQSFNLVPFYNYENVYGVAAGGTAGPLGSDIRSPWLSGDKVLELYASLKKSWLDVHACTEVRHTDNRIDSSYYKAPVNLRQSFLRLFPEELKSRIKRLIGYRLR